MEGDDNSSGEPRGFQRIHAAYAVKIEVSARPKQSVVTRGAVHGVTREISRGDVLVELDAVVPENSPCIVRFLFAGDRVQPDMVWGRIRAITRRSGTSFAHIEFDTPLELLKLPVPDTEEAPAQPGGRILVVDDEQPVRDVLRRFLEGQGYEVVVASDGKGALGACRQHAFAAILLDLYLPKLNGLEVLRQLREEGRDASVIYTMSGKIDDDAARESLRLGANDFLVKPISLDYLQWNLKLRLRAAGSA